MKAIRSLLSRIHRIIVSYVEVRVIELKEAGKITQAKTTLFAAVVWGFISAKDADDIQKRNALE